MIMLALAPPSIAVVSFDHRCATPIPHVVTGRPGSSPHRSCSKQASNARRQQTASIEIPIASDAPPRHTSRGFLLWRFAYAGPRCPPSHHHGAGIRKPSHQRTSQPNFWMSVLHPDTGHSLAGLPRLRKIKLPCHRRGKLREHITERRRVRHSGVMRGTLPTPSSGSRFLELPRTVARQARLR